MKLKIVFENKYVIAAFSTKKFGHLGFNPERIVLANSLKEGTKNNPDKKLKENRKNFLQTLNIPHKNLVCAKQIHGARILYVTDKYKSRGALNYKTAVDSVDGLVTNKKNIPLAVFTADCLSIFLHDPTKHAIGIMHAGWRSSKEKIARKTILAMKKNFGTKPQNLIVYFGPAIRACCYKVGKDFRKYFPDAIIKRKKDFYLDLIKVNKKQLVSVGVKKERIFDSQICTSCNTDKFFSYRKEKENAGRIMSVIMLK